jgi:hypothetical protein
MGNEPNGPSSKSDKEKLDLVTTSVNGGIGGSNVVLLRKKNNMNGGSSYMSGNKLDNYNAIHSPENESKWVSSNGRSGDGGGGLNHGFKRIMPRFARSVRNNHLHREKIASEKDQVPEIVVINLLNLFVFYVFLIFAIGLNLFGLWLFPYYIRTPQIITEDK